MTGSTPQDFETLPEQVRDSLASAADNPGAIDGVAGAGRCVQLTRTTKETDILLTLDLDGTGQA